MKSFNQRVKSIALSICLLAVTHISFGQNFWEPTINGQVYTGKPDRLFILVETQDVRMATPNAQQAFERQLNQDGYNELGCVGSVNEFLRDNSGGKFDPTFHVLGPVMLELPMYTEEGGGPCYFRDNPLMIAHAVVMAKKMYPDIDFSIFDNDKNGVLDPIFVCYANTGPNVPWPHASGIGGSGWSVNGYKIPGIQIDSYAIGPERAPNGTQAGYTLFLHEFGHTLGLPDDYTGRLGKFSIYCDGTFDGGIIPVNFNAAERTILGWLDYQVIDKDGEYTLESLSKNKALMLKTDNPDEYFLFSYRDNSGADTPWDAKFGHGGMLVWHIDRSQTVIDWSDDNGAHKTKAIDMWYGNHPNSASNHPCHELVEADNINKPHRDDYRSGMYFPGPGNVTRLNSSTHSEFTKWNGDLLGIDISNIRKDAATNTIKFNVRFEGSAAVKINVTDKTSGKALLNTYVSLKPGETTAEKLEGLTNSSGYSIFTGVKSGPYELIVDKEGYQLHMETISVLNGSNIINIQLEDSGAGSDVPVESITFEKESAGLMVGGTMTLRPVVKPLNVVNRTLEWKSSDPAVAEIDNSGKITGRATGVAVITATSVQTPAVKATFTINVGFNAEMITIDPFQRDARISWPGYNADQKWEISWRKTGASEYISAPAQALTTIYLRNLDPDAEYEGIIKPSGKNDMSVAFEFTSQPLTSKFSVIYLPKTEFAVGDVLPLIVNNIQSKGYTVKWRLDNASFDKDEYECAKAGKCELKAEVKLSDGSTEVLIAEVKII